MGKANQIFCNRNSSIMPSVSKILAKKYERIYAKEERKQLRRVARYNAFKKYVARKKATQPAPFRLKLGGLS